MQALTRTHWIIGAVVLLLLAASSFFLFGDTSSILAASAVDAAAEDTAAHAAAHEAADAAPKTGLAAYDKNGDGIVYQGGMHPNIVQDEPGQCPICGMDLSPVSVDGMEEGTVKIDPVTLQNMGVRTATVSVEPLGREIRTTGRFKMDEQGERTVSMKISGWVEKLYADYEGARVRKGQPLLDIYSPDLVSTQEEYLLALRNAKRLEGTAAAQDSERLVEAARRRLAYWDLSEAQIREIEETGEPKRVLTFYATSSGEVMRKQVTEGDYVEAGQTLMDIVDLSKVWLIVDIYEQDLSWVEIGTAAKIQLPYEPGRLYEGRIDYIYHMLDNETRSAQARIILPGGHNAPLKPGMYATVRLTGRETEPSPVVPAEAVLRSGDAEVVVLALGEGRFRPVPVEAGVETGGKVQILEGLEGGEQVVTSAQFLIDSEARLQSAVGAMAAPAEENGAEEASAEAATATVQDGVQIARITIGPDGYEPQQIQLEKGQPTRLVFTRTTDGTCATQIQAPELGIAKTDLPLNEPVAFEITPREDGSYTFACGMDMVKGTIIVSS